VKVKSGRVTAAALVVIVAIGAALRFRHLGAYPLDFDESFTAMVGRLPLGSVAPFLRRADSHPPLDYALQLPLARVAASPFFFRLPAVCCSIAALGLFAWWMRDRGFVGIAATGAMAISAFQIAHGREARMYAPMELIGVGAAVLSESWLRTPRRRHAVIVGALTFVGLMTHVSMALAAVGLLALAGLRRDAHAWWWRAGIGAGMGGWAVVWGGSFLVQARGGHSTWIPHTTPRRLVNTVASLVTSSARVSLLVTAAVVAGCIVCWYYDRVLAKVLLCGFGVPTVLAAIIGLHAPVLLDRTLTVAAWGPLLALGCLAAFFVQHGKVLGVGLVGAGAGAMLVAVPGVLGPTGPTTALTALERVARPGDIVAIEPPSKGVELDWTFGARSDDGRAGSVALPGIHNAVALALTSRPASGRIWVVQMSPQRIDLRGYQLCARPWKQGSTRLLCLRRPTAELTEHTSTPSIAALYAEYAGPRVSRPRPRPLSAGGAGADTAAPCRTCARRTHRR
jgi:hypothetical protein